MEYKEILVQEFTPESLKEFRKEVLEFASKNQQDPIVVNISSYGGSADIVGAMIDTLNSVPNPIVTCAIGMAMSAGAILLSCGHVRYASPNTRIMLHEISSLLMGNIKEINVDHIETNKLNDRYMTLLAKNMKMNLAQFRALFKDKRDLYLSPEEAIKLNLIDAIGIPFMQTEVSKVPVIIPPEAKMKIALSNQEEAKKSLKEKVRSVKK